MTTRAFALASEVRLVGGSSVPGSAKRARRRRALSSYRTP